ncbi:type II secretion system F family protein [Burkholderia ubonensis]|uniref:type II secretion system F family protein n=1 Tax=Burkholderia ubonensis TaxID=101571 RepID=UPI000751F8B0|nr:type II secretion system F family protein [Burkholderia ubonensis]KVG18962.1 general secretion pathway protein GspF [Burkholderia ubonensis]KVP83440.1 general secretion pathway protein GspF [Burkholderia ubonensis]OJA67971.1 general secretion pathway protein GspF [Burkholderia ubonensis]
MKFVLRVFDTSGSVQTVRVDSDSPASASALARSRGFRVVSVSADARRRRGANRLGMPGARFNVELFARELAALLDAGVGVVDALRTLGGNERREASAQVYRDLLRQLEEGQSLSAALEHASDVFPPVLVACVKASEQTGGLAGSLTRYSRNSATLHELRTRVVSAAIYPTVLLFVGAAVVLFLLGFVVPRFATLLEHSGRELPLMSRLLMAWGGMVHAHGAGLGIGLAVLAVATALALRRPALRIWLADRLLALPGIGQHFRVFRQSQFYRTTAMLVDGGIPAVRAFDLARGLVGGADRAALALALQQVRNGARISDAFQQAGLANAIAYRLLTVAEKTGGLGRVLDRIAAFQEAQVARTIDLISRLIEPAMMIVIGVVIGGIVVLMYLPIFEIASSIQ